MSDFYKNIHNEAVAAGNKAALEVFEKHGEPFFCGFAWINVTDLKCTVTKEFLKVLDPDIVDKNYSGKGKTLFLTRYINIPWVYKQSMDIK